jgi:hypothetical protein
MTSHFTANVQKSSKFKSRSGEGCLRSKIQRPTKNGGPGGGGGVIKPTGKKILGHSLVNYIRLGVLRPTKK